MDEDDEDEYGAPAKRRATGKGPEGQAALLYAEEGQLNPHAARAARKKVKTTHRYCGSISPRQHTHAYARTHNHPRARTRA